MANGQLERILAFCLAIQCIFSLTGCGSGTLGSTPAVNISRTQNPLVAEYDAVAPQSGSQAWVEFGEDTTYGRQTSTSAATTSVGQTIKLLVAGMKASTTYHMRGHFDWPGGSWLSPDQTFTTGAIPSDLIEPKLTVSRPNANLQPSPGVELLSLSAQNDVHILEALVTDLQGNIIWYYDVGQGNYPEPLKPVGDGNFLIVNSSGFVGFVLKEIDLAGNVIRQLSPAQLNESVAQAGYLFNVTQFHHDVAVLPNGHWIVLVNTLKDFTDLPGYPGTTTVTGDALIDLDPHGNVVWAWNSFDHLDVNRHLFGLPDWTHSNAVVYTPNDGNLLLSMRNQSWILKIDYENGQGTGNILWRLGDQGDFSITGGDPSQWFYGQHFPSLISTNGAQMNMAVFDDGNGRIFEDGDVCGNPGAPKCYSRAPIYQVDESTRTATVLWQYLPNLYTFWGGSINQLPPSNNVEFDLSEPYLTQGDPSGSIVMEVTQISNPQVVWQMRMDGANAYRAYRVPSLYPGVTWQK
jgi:arylsulfate sulfotransferase